MKTSFVLFVQDDEDKRSIEREIFGAELIPESPTHLTFWEKFLELQIKMLVTNQVPKYSFSVLKLRIIKLRAGYKLFYKYFKDPLHVIAWQ